MTRMVLSTEPVHLHEGPPNAAEERRNCAEVWVMDGISERSVGGPWEQDARMPSSRIGQRSKASFITKNVVRWAACAALLCFALAGAAAHGQSAGSWNKRGQQAEAREDFDAAFEAYRQAHL